MFSRIYNIHIDKLTNLVSKHKYIYLLEYCSNSIKYYHDLLLYHKQHKRYYLVKKKIGFIPEQKEML
jgi:hypothetical protein